MHPTMLTPETLTIWAALAFALWVALTGLLTGTHSTILTATAALLSWLAVGAALPWLRLLLSWIIRRPGA